MNMTYSRKPEFTTGVCKVATGCDYSVRVTLMRS